MVGSVMFSYFCFSKLISTFSQLNRTLVNLEYSFRIKNKYRIKMIFLYPLFLFALLALAIPVIIHLFNFKRYKTVYFSNVPLLKRIKQESRKKTQLKQLLILIARLLAIASLVFAFSRPYIPLNKRTSNASRQVVAIYIDNTFSMKAEGENGRCLNRPIKGDRNCQFVPCWSSVSFNYK